ncbi:MAG: trigger factor [Gemmataceae bacterium]|nr:trigger factor [Gemmataceae bacterium]
MTDDAATIDSPEAEHLDGAEQGPVKIKQNVEVLEIGPCKKHIKVTIDRSDIDQRLNDKFSRLVLEHRSHVRGFRPGKAPRKMIEKLYKEEVYREVRGELLLGSLEQLAEEQDIAPLAPPNLEPGKIVIPDAGDMIYEFDVEVRPQFDLPEYKGLKLKRPVQTFTQADIERERNRLLEPYGELVTKEGGTVETGDLITVDIQTRLGDRQLNDLKDVTLRVDPRLALRDGVAKKFGKEIGGAKVGDSRLVKIDLSDAAADADLRGKTVDSTFTVKEIKQYKIPDLTPKLLAEFDVKSVDALDELIRVVLERRLQYLQRQSARSQIIAKVGDEAIKELPQDLLLRQARRALGRKQMEMQNAGMKEEEILGRSRILQSDIVRNTALALKEHFVLQKIAEDEKLDIEDHDIDAEIERIAARGGESPRKVRARLEKEDLIESLAAELLETKALDLILESAEFEDEAIDTEASDDGVATVEEQLVPGEVQDPLAEDTGDEPEAKE